jgi:hypothetical protein
MGNIRELAWRVDEFLPDLVGKLNCGEEIANAKTEAHRNIKHSSVLKLLSIRESRLRESRE